MRVFRKGQGAANLLSRDRERELLGRVRSGDDRAAMDELVRSHIRLVAKIAVSVRRPHLDMDDLIQEGCIGLMIAARKFDLSENVRFATYAQWWVRAQMFSWAERSAHNRPGKGRRRPESPVVILSLEDRASPTSPTLAEMIGDDTPLQDQVLEDRVELEISLSRLMGAIAALSAREQQIILARRLSEDGATLNQVGHDLGISKERVRQIESAAIEKLKGYLTADGESAAV